MSNVIDIDMGWAKIREAIKTSHGDHYTKVGFPSEKEPATVKDGHSATMADMVQIASIHEFGAPKAHIPERSFVRSTHDNKITEINEMIDKEEKSIFDGTSTVKKSLARVGEFVASEMKKTIEKRIPPALSPLTIKSKTVNGKRGDVPLIDTAQMIQSITHVEV